MPTNEGTDATTVETEDTDETETEQTDAAETPPAPEGDAPPPKEGEEPKPKEGEPERPAEPPKTARAKDLAATLRAKAEARKEARAARHEREAVRSALERERAELARERQAVERLRAKIAELPGAPEKVPEVLGIDKETYFRRMLNDGKPAPEEEVGALKQDVAALRKELADRQQAERMEAQRAREAAAYQRFTRDLLESGKYEHATIVYEPEQIAAEARRVVEWAIANGHVYREDEIADYIDRKARAEYNKIKARENERASRKSNEPHAAGSQAANGHTTRPGTTRTLTNKGAQERATPPRQETEEELDARLLAELKAATKKDREARGA